MKAVVIEAKGQTPVIGDYPKPLPLPGYAVVEVKAAALNHRDVFIAQGLYANVKYPFVPGSDGAGIVAAVGNGVDSRGIGQEVVINPSHHWGADEAFQGAEYKILGLPDPGTMAAYVAVPAQYLQAKPTHLTMEQAAALPLAGLTAFRALFSRSRVQPGDRVLVTGIGGGVALFALQFALAIGCEVWVTSGKAEKIQSAMAMGAKGGANYKEEDWRKKLQEKAGLFDVFIDGAGGAGFAELVNLAAPGARIAIYGGTAGPITDISPQRLFWKQISILGSTMGSDADFHNMLRFVNDHKICPVIDEVMPMEDAAAAFEKMQQGSQFGKLVLTVG